MPSAKPAAPAPIKVTNIWQTPADVTRSSPPEERLARVYVWDRVVRTTHWAIALSIFTLAVTGFLIGRPVITTTDATGPHFLMGWVRAIHFYAAIVFTLAVLTRILWSIVGTPPALWPNFLPVTKRRWNEMRETLLFYTFFRKSFPPVLSHNPLAGYTYTVVYILFGVMILTGLGLYGLSASVESPMHWFGFFAAWFGGPGLARWIHHLGMWLVLGFFVHHLYSAVLASAVEKNGILESIFTGFKWIDWKDVHKG